MTDKEKIRAFIEGRKKENWEKRYNNSGGDLFWDRANEDDEILSFIDSLQEEPAHRTKANVDAAMQDVEVKSKAFTDAHKGESAEEILAGMKGIDPSIQNIVDKHWFEMLGEEPILEVLEKYLDHVSKEEAMKTKGAIDRWFAEYYPEHVSDALDEAAKRYATKGDEISGEFIIQEEVAAFKAGAKWKYQQMTARAIPCSVIYHPNNMIADYSLSAYVPPLHPASAYISKGNNIKLVIIKEE